MKKLTFSMCAVLVCFTVIFAASAAAGNEQMPELGATELGDAPYGVDPDSSLPVESYIDNDGVWTTNAGIGDAQSAETAENDALLNDESADSIEAEEEQPPIVDVFVHGILLESLTPPILIDGATYVPLRDFSYAYGEGVEVEWDGETQSISIKTPPINITLNVNEPYIVSNGRYIYIKGGVLLRDGVTFIPVRAISKAFGAVVEWDSDLFAVNITGGIDLISGDKFYNEEDLYWLSRIISAEAKGEIIDGQIAVGNVVLNRMAHDKYPDTIYDVIFDRNGAIQFSPVASGTIKDNPTDSAIIAAKMVLDGASVTTDSLFFLNENQIKDSWITRNCVYVMTIGNHSFYKISDPLGEPIPGEAPANTDFTEGEPEPADAVKPSVVQVVPEAPTEPEMQNDNELTEPINS
jgi:N-acetylmuramoyl-L-alanine amidase